MIRRRFLQLATMAGVGGLAPLEGMAAAATRTVTYFVQGFSCITCATGLDTMLSRQKGIASSQSTYPEGKVTVSFHPNQITEQAIVTFITDLGFTVKG
jgi:copper chaperone CopZ